MQLGSNKAPSAAPASIQSGAPDAAYAFCSDAPWLTGWSSLLFLRMR